MLNRKLAIAVSGKHAEEVKGVCFTIICANFYVLETLYEIQTFTWYFFPFFAFHHVFLPYTLFA